MEELHSHHCQVTIEGIGEGILLHNPSGMGKGGKTAKREVYIPEIEAEAACYKTSKGELGFPAENIRCGLIRACSGWKVPGNKKLSLSPVVAGDVSISPSMISFGTKKYEIDTRRVVVQRQGILRSRPKLPEWKLTFIISWEGQYLGDDFDSTVLPELLERLGKTIGIGDYRPACRGPFGRFKIVSIKKM